MAEYKIQYRIGAQAAWRTVPFNTLVEFASHPRAYQGAEQQLREAAQALVAGKEYTFVHGNSDVGRLQVRPLPEPTEEADAAI